MESLQEQVKQICSLADNIILNPELPPKQIAQRMKVSAGVLGAVNGTGLVAGPLTIPIIGIFYYIWKKYSDFKKKQLEKERMLREVIAKQQAVIRKLEEELKKSAIQNENNRIEIENLKEMLRILKETEEQIKNAE